MANERYAALETLLRVDERGGYSNIALAQTLRESGLDARQRAFCTALVYGVLERQITLDCLLAPRVARPLDKLDRPVLCILRMGAYQLYYMDAVPDASAVDESVKLCRAVKKTSAGGLVNGVLRALLRAGKPAPPKTGSAADQMGIEYAAPGALVEHLANAYGMGRARAFLADALRPAPVFIRVNRLKTDRAGLLRALEGEGVAATPCGDLPDAARLESPGDLEGLRAWREGLFHVQDISSQRCALALDAQPGMAVLDVCAAPGGKSFTAAQQMQNRGRIAACDIHAHKMELLRSGALRLGIDIIEPLARGAEDPAPAPGGFDRVLCDVPCSGLGALRRRPEIRVRGLARMATLPALQYKILENSSQYVHAGGLLVYSTCTLNPAENEEVADRFLREHTEYAPSPCGTLEGEWRATSLPSGDTDGDGFFIAVLRRVTGGAAG